MLSATIDQIKRLQCLMLLVPEHEFMGEADWVGCYSDYTCTSLRELPYKQFLRLYNHIVVLIYRENERNNIRQLAHEFGITIGKNPMTLANQAKLDAYLQKHNWIQNDLENCREAELEHVEFILQRLLDYCEEYGQLSKKVKKNPHEALEIMQASFKTRCLLHELNIPVEQ